MPTRVPRASTGARPTPQPVRHGRVCRFARSPRMRTRPRRSPPVPRSAARAPRPGLRAPQACPRPPARPRTPRGRHPTGRPRARSALPRGGPRPVLPPSRDHPAVTAYASAVPGPGDANRMTGTRRTIDSRVGAGITPFQADDEATIRLAVAAEELGYARFGAAEGWTHDAVVLLTRIAGVTSRIGLATAVLPVWSRTPAAIAMAAASLQRASGGRFALGLGASSPPLVEGLHGLTWQEPLGRMRATLVAVRALLDGARVPLDRERIRPLRLGAPPEQRVPIFLAALAPASVRLAGELADHWLPFLWARSRLSDGRALDHDRGCNERPARDRRERRVGQADRRRLAARLPHAHGPALPADAAGPVRLQDCGRRAARGQRQRRAATTADRGGAARSRRHRDGDLR